MNGGAKPRLTSGGEAAVSLLLFHKSFSRQVSKAFPVCGARFHTLCKHFQVARTSCFRRTFQVCGKRFQVLCTLRKSLPDRHAAPNSHRTSFLGREDRLELVWGDDFELGEGAVAGLLVGAPAAELGRVTKTIALHVIVGNLDH